jgi:hypothetical protein
LTRWQQRKDFSEKFAAANRALIEKAYNVGVIQV